jgi:hypothetical protein
MLALGVHVGVVNALETLHHTLAPIHAHAAFWTFLTMQMHLPYASVHAIRTRVSRMEAARQDERGQGSWYDWLEGETFDSGRRQAERV